jgi:hypothetical protein
MPYYSSSAHAELRECTAADQLTASTGHTRHVCVRDCLQQLVSVSLCILVMLAYTQARKSVSQPARPPSQICRLHPPHRQRPQPPSSAGSPTGTPWHLYIRLSPTVLTLHTCLACRWSYGRAGQADGAASRTAARTGGGACMLRCPYSTEA